VPLEFLEHDILPKLGANFLSISYPCAPENLSNLPSQPSVTERKKFVTDYGFSAFLEPPAQRAVVSG
jgi:hypothetical protein